MTTWTGSVPTFVAGDTTTVPANLNILRDILKALSDPWTAYVPAWTATTTNPVLNNGTIVGYYRQVGHDVEFWIRLTLGAGTTVGSGIYQLSVPVPPVTGHPMMFDVQYVDASGSAIYGGQTAFVSGSTLNLLCDGSNAGGVFGGFTAVSPVVPAVGDVYIVSGSYQAA